MRGMFEVVFEFCDAYTHGKFVEQSCVVSAGSSYEAEKECKKLYGLGVDCDYRIISVKEI